MSLLIGNNVVATIHYTLTDDSGEVIDSSQGSEPLTYLHGAGNLIPGLEKALEGSEADSSLQVRIPPEEGYGDVRPELIEAVPRAAFQGVDKVEPGMVFEARSADGQARRIVVKSINGDSVTVDANHPLAGVALNFDVQVVELREASEEEVSHGHAH
jgi:FKBP-type peptidyl-prolyl cis-trans isomerase SlyD